MNFADAAERVLRDHGAPMSITDITNEALDLGLISPKSDRPAVYVRAAIRKESRKREGQGQSPRFTKLPDGSYELNG